MYAIAIKKAGRPFGLLKGMGISKDHILRQLQRRILTLELEPGQPLDEVRLSEEFNVSRTPMREILRRLAGEGYVQIRDQRGPIVAPMDPKSMRNFFLTAPMIYAATSRLAAQLATPAQIDALAEIQMHFKNAVSEEAVDSLVYYNDRFHSMIGEMADNAFLAPSLQRLLIDHARIGQTFWKARTDGLYGRVLEASRHHDMFIEIFAANDEEAAVALTIEHWELSRANIETYIRPIPLPINMKITG